MAVTPVCTLGPGAEELRVLKPTLRLGTSTRALRGPGWPGKLRSNPHDACFKCVFSEITLLLFSRAKIHLE